MKPTTCTTCHQDLPRDIHRSPPPTSLLRRNHIPSGAEAAQVQQRVCQEDSNVAHIDADIATCLDKLEQLRKERQDAISRAAQYQSLFSAVRALPEEILSMIMIKVMQILSTELPDKRPIHLSHVSFFWRQTALNTPALWTSVQLNHTTTKAEYCSLFIQRSQNLPLSIELRCHDQWHLTVIRDILFAECHRWQGASFNGLSFSGYEALQALKGKLHSLERLKMSGARLLSRVLDCDAFEDAPVLQDLSIDTPLSRESLRLPWASLTSCSLNGLRVDYCLDTLSACPQLVICRLHDCSSCDPFLTTGLPSSPIVMNDLETLSISIARNFDGASACSQIFPHLTLPAIRHLELSEFGEWPQEQFVALLERSKCTMRSLRLLEMKITYNEFLACLLVVPCLRELIIGSLWSVFVEDVVVFLGSHVPDYLPHLKRVEIFDGTVVRSPSASRLLGNMARARSGPISTLQVVVHHGSIGVPTPPTLDALSALREEGLNITLCA